MTATMQNGRPRAEARRTPVVTDQGPIRHGDTNEANARAARVQALRAQHHAHLDALMLKVDARLASFRQAVAR